MTDTAAPRVRLVVPADWLDHYRRHAEQSCAAVIADGGRDGETAARILDAIRGTLDAAAAQARPGTLLPVDRGNTREAP